MEPAVVVGSLSLTGAALATEEGQEFIRTRLEPEDPQTVRERDRAAWNDIELEDGR